MVTSIGCPSLLTRGTCGAQSDAAVFRTEKTLAEGREKIDDIVDSYDQIGVRHSEVHNESSLVAPSQTFHEFAGHVQASQVRRPSQSFFVRCPPLPALSICLDVLLQLKDRSLVWNTDLLEAVELENLLINAAITVHSAEQRKVRPSSTGVRNKSRSSSYDCSQYKSEEVKHRGAQM